MNDDAKRRVAATYNAAADCFDASPLGFWERIGRRTVERLGALPGARVLDVCCGSGASAIPAAQAVVPQGRVLAVDIAQKLLDLGAAKAARLHVRNLEFRCIDLEMLDEPDGSFDAVVCVFGIFFFPDMPAAVRRLWRLVRPGGRLAITTWGPRVLEPGSTIFWEAVRRERADLFRAFNPWERIDDPESLRALLMQADVRAAEIAAEAGVQPLRSPDDFWTIVMGSGYRGTLAQLDAAACERVRAATLAEIAAHSVSAVEANAVYAIAHKPLNASALSGAKNVV